MKYRKDQPQTIQNMFGSIAKEYDRTNGILSFQIHRFWNKQLLDHIKKAKEVKNPKNKNQKDIHQDLLPNSLLDLCSGTGEIAFSYLKKSSSPKKVYLLDFCKEMLDCAKIKSQKLGVNQVHQISFLEADAELIPLENEAVEAVTVAYGIRNIQNIEKTISEVFRVLKPGGSFGILELTKPKNLLLKSLHKIYLQTILPFIGKLLTSNKDAYDYLNKSIGSFVKPEKLELILQQKGFTETFHKPLLGGIATLIFGKKP